MGKLQSVIILILRCESKSIFQGWSILREQFDMNGFPESQTIIIYFSNLFFFYLVCNKQGNTLNRKNCPEEPYSTVRLHHRATQCKLAPHTPNNNGKSSHVYVCTKPRPSCSTWAENKVALVRIDRGGVDRIRIDLVCTHRYNFMVWIKTPLRQFPGVIHSACSYYE